MCVSRRGTGYGTSQLWRVQSQYIHTLSAFSNIAKYFHEYEIIAVV